MKWYNTEISDGIVLSTRVRLARNISGYPFSTKLDEVKKSELFKEIVNAFNKYGTSRYNYIDISHKSLLENSAMVEEHIISKEFALMPPSENRILITDDNGNISIMVGEEDHLRIQSIYPGFSIKDAYISASNIDKNISKGINFAFDERFGYLTCCPSNTGTGMRVSCMLHLPMLTSNNYIKAVIEYCSRQGLTVRGFMGEGTDAGGNIYQISNQTTLGISEENTLDRISEAVKIIVEKETELRNKFKNEDISLIDKLWRSYGIMTSARCINAKEFLVLWSDCMLGKTTGIIDKLDDVNMVKILVECMTAHIMLVGDINTDMDSRESIVRAERIRNFIS